jgi:predicted RNase H-like nuclease (RuvC/YqgF family)
MAKTDPKDDRILELELALEALRKELAAAQDAASQYEALKAEIASLIEENKKEKECSKTLAKELESLKVTAGTEARATVKGLNPAKAVELKISSMVRNAITGQGVAAVAGSVLVEKSALAEVQKVVGTTVTLHPVDAEEIDAARKAGRAY